MNVSQWMRHYKAVGCHLRINKTLEVTGKQYFPKELRAIISNW